MYFLSRPKENMNFTVMAFYPIDPSDKRNEGITQDQVVAMGHGASVRRIVFIDPLDATEHLFITNEMKLPPGLIAGLYLRGWDIEKAFYETKNRLGEKKLGPSLKMQKKYRGFL